MLSCSQAAPVEALQKRDLCMDARVKPGHAGRLMPDAARERVAKPPAGTALARAIWECLPGASERGEVQSLCNVNGDVCQ
jgi:hypothetical protein